ncbi:PPK2 family polyphosphate kinase [Leucobacter sp. M11]|uniref:PPK2 family polyphosphate kinase n=1 Tax=Leucobacter sp. M11 TaxID=2993565 RepID=UPI002D7E47E2|nr:PPK2 family polyphosphate kinase [Leucobacter sp. M11]MEB4614646.1 polyphosphate kinase 2 family protein [Leucobacter sp. M11]
MAKEFWTESVSELLRVRPGFRLAEVDPSSTPGTVADQKRGEKHLAAESGRLKELQERLYAESAMGGTDRVLLILQAMDAAGKGGIVNHVLGQIDPHGLHLSAFKKPTAEEREHDFLWRIAQRVPEAGVIGVFDRSHYEDVLIQRVRQMAPPEEIERRYGAINDFEAGLVGAHTRIVKVMLHISPEQQAKRLLDRLARPEKQWKYNPGDADERLLWAEYQEAFQVMLDRTCRDDAPWYVVPADNKWYARVAVQRILTEVLEGIDPDWPAPDYDVAAERERIEASRGTL